MGSTFTLRVIASDKIFYDGKCIQLIIPAVDGEIGILAHHENMVIAITAGDLRLQTEEGSWIEAAVGVGFVQIANNRVTVLADTAERPEDIDANRARRAADEAKEAILQKRSMQEYQAAQVNLARAINRLRIKRMFGGE